MHSDNDPMHNRGIRIEKKDRKRERALTEVCRGNMTLKDAAPFLEVKYRQAKRLKKAYVEEGIKGIIHGNRGREPANKASEEARQSILDLSTERYSKANDTHFTELLKENEGIGLSRETVRRIRRDGNIKPKRKQQVGKHRKRRQRKPSAGMMVLWDGSPHKWFGDKRDACCAIAAMDDATGMILALLFIERECSLGYMRVLREVVEGYGIPMSIYQDKNSALRRNDKHWTLEEELAGRQEPTQVGAALERLGIEPIFADSPQAKGRIERVFQVLQDRLVVGFELAGIKDIESANRYAKEVFIGAYNSKFAVEPTDPESAWVEVGNAADLDRIISFKYGRKVGNDNAIRMGGVVIDIPPGPKNRGYAGLRVEVRQLLDGSWRVYHADQMIAMAPATPILERRSKGLVGNGKALSEQQVYLASKPERDHCEPTPIRGAAGTVRRAGPGRAIGAVRIA